MMTWKKKKQAENAATLNEIKTLENALNEYRHEIIYYQNVLADSQDQMIHTLVNDPEWDKQLRIQKNAAEKISLYNRLEKDLHKRVEELRDELS